jgi:hypothetical protein
MNIDNKAFATMLILKLLCLAGTVGGVLLMASKYKL